MPWLHKTLVPSLKCSSQRLEPVLVLPVRFRLFLFILVEFVSAEPYRRDILLEETEAKAENRRCASVSSHSSFLGLLYTVCIPVPKRKINLEKSASPPSCESPLKLQRNLEQ